jgi:hypothetical protein
MNYNLTNINTLLFKNKIELKSFFIIKKYNHVDKSQIKIHGDNQIIWY